jgi:hypothetical protein
VCTFFQAALSLYFLNLSLEPTDACVRTAGSTPSSATHLTVDREDQIKREREQSVLLAAAAEEAAKVAVESESGAGLGMRDAQLWDAKGTGGKCVGCHDITKVHNIYSPSLMRMCFLEMHNDFGAMS